MNQRLALLGLIVFCLFACKKFKEEKEQENLDQYRANFVRGCVKGDESASSFPSGEKQRVCECIADVYMRDKGFDDLVAEESSDASTGFVAPAVEACKFEPRGRAWAVRVPAPKPLELYTPSTEVTKAEPLSEELTSALDLRDQKQFEQAEPIFRRLVTSYPLDAEYAFEHYINLAFLHRTDDALDALESAYNLGYNNYPNLRYMYKPGAVGFSKRYEKVLAGLRDRYNKTPPPLGTALAFKAKGRRPKSGFPVVVVLHAYGSSGANWIEFSQDWASRGFVVITLPGSLPQGKGRLAWHVATVEPTHDQIQLALKSELIADQIDPKKVILIGYGQGAQHAVGVAFEHSEAYSAVFAMSPGGPPEALQDRTTLETKGKPRLVIVTGTGAESTPRSLRYQRLAASAGWPVVLLQQPGADAFPVEYPQNGVAIMDYLMGKKEAIQGSEKLKPLDLDEQ